MSLCFSSPALLPPRSRRLFLSKHVNPLPTPAANPHRTPHPALRAPTMTSSPPRPQDTTAQIPHAVRDANVVVVGGGPSGLFSAMALAERGVSVTVVERKSYAAPMDVSRAYMLCVLPRGRTALEKVPGLADFLSRASTRFRRFIITVVRDDGTALPPFHPRFEGSSVKFLNTRLGFVRSMKHFADRYPNISILEESELTDVQYGKDGEMRLTVHTGGQERQLHTKLVLACDGKNSVLGRMLEEASKRDPSLLISSKGLGTEEKSSASSGLRIKALVIRPGSFAHLPEITDDVERGGNIVALSGSPKRSNRERFGLGIWQMPRDQFDTLGGFLGLVIRPADNAVWDLKDVEDGYSAFEANFPYFPVRRCVSEESMRQFVHGKTSTFGQVARRKSLVVHVGRKEAEGPEGGVVFLGDSSHSFPPDSGQGVSAGFQDVAVLMDVLERVGQGAGVAEVLVGYEEARERDLQGLMTVARFCGPYQYGQSKVGTLLTGVNVLMRRWLAKMFPGVIHPAIVELMGTGLSYGEIARRANVTTARLGLGAFSVALLPVFGAMAFRMLYME